MNKKTKFPIKVYSGPTRVEEVIFRQIRFEQIGNFSPAFCTYKGKRHLVKSKEGDLSDPFRREESYAEKLFIEIY